MSAASRRPSLFIGSSREGLDVAYALQESLEYDAEPTVWPQGVFNPTSTTLQDLVAIARRTDFAAFVFTPDDMRVMRGEKADTPRDNVVFELGLLIGARGVERCFFLIPRDQALTLPTDLLGLAPLTYVANRGDGNLLAALGPASNKIRRALRLLGEADVEIIAPSETPSDPVAEAQEFVARWSQADLQSARDLLRGGGPLHMVEDETGDATSAMKRVFAFFESMADGVLAGRLDEALARQAFATSLHTFWRHAYIYLAPLNQADEWWTPPPSMAELDDRWGGRPD